MQEEEEEVERGLGRRHETERQVGERGRHGGMDGITISRTRGARGVTMGKTWGAGGLEEWGGKSAAQEEESSRKRIPHRSLLTCKRNDPAGELGGGVSEGGMAALVKERRSNKYLMLTSKRHRGRGITKWM